MKNKAYHLLIASIISFSLLSLSSAAEARHCKWVGQHWSHGHLVPAHKVCWDNNRYQRNYRHCRWVGGHTRHGQWYPARKVCR